VAEVGNVFPGRHGGIKDRLPFVERDFFAIEKE
jgi:hypothetical protein